MRELSLVEIESVSGAGIGADIGSKLGGFFGKAIDKGFHLITGKEASASQVNPLTEIGTGIGYLVDSRIHGEATDRSNGLTNLFKGVGDSLSAAYTNIKGLMS
ncbi:MAG: hypothetical protein M3Z67_00690 [Commensalibacter sp.]|nr:hypothetical protein [Commensalibacter sp.]MCT6878992.1 hypothetical protein [Commensalibacter sp.]